MLPTPSTSHVNFDNIYEPAEDSFLLLDTISSKSEVDFLRQQFPENATVPLVVEIGTGSGVVLAFVNAHASQIFSTSNILTMAVDVNRFACLATQATVEKAVKDFSSKKTKAGTFLATAQADLASCFKAGSIDMLIFNPPYVPSEESPAAMRAAVSDSPPDVQQSRSAKFERDSRLLALSYAGGVDGMETTTRLLDGLMHVLNPRRGVAYVLLCAQNRPDAVVEYVRSWGAGWNVVVAGSSGRTAGWEKLQIIRVWRSSE